MGSTVQNPLIARIQRLSMDDGPGLRDVVFFKGCRLSCTWCHNPETVEAEATVLFFKEHCIGCQECLGICPNGAIAPWGGYRIDRSRCRKCGKCAETCPARAIEMAGRAYAPKTLVETLLRDALYFENSGGGVTFSGGEPTLHMAYLEEVSVLLKKKGISIALQTSGDFDWGEFEKHLLPHVDWIYFDIKLMDPVQHRRYAGVGNRRILSNFAMLSKAKSSALIPRTPMIPGITDSEENLRQIVEFLAGFDVGNWVQLPFNPAFLAKQEWVGRTPRELRY